jgi:hypothetical protein
MSLDGAAKRSDRAGSSRPSINFDELASTNGESNALFLRVIDTIDTCRDTAQGAAPS